MTEQVGSTQSIEARLVRGDDGDYLEIDESVWGKVCAGDDLLQPIFDAHRRGPPPKFDSSKYLERTRSMSPNTALRYLSSKAGKVMAKHYRANKC